VLLSRRLFLGSIATGISAPALIAAPRRHRRLPICFSTLGCPKWDWETILRRAGEWGYAAIELRGIQGEMDLTKRAEFGPTRLSATLGGLRALGIEVAKLGSSVRLHEAEASARAKQLEEGRRFIDLAQRLGSSFVRVFGDRMVAGEPREATVARVVSGLRELSEHARGSGVTVLLESHGDFCDSPTLQELFEGVDRRNVELLWDAHHTVVMGKEEPAFTLRKLGRHVRHVHLKDSRPAGQEVRYVLTGDGTVPVRETVRQLVRRRYRGYYSFEWEKAWHPEIDEPEVAFPHFAKTIGVYLREAGYRPT
jgi:sugar phosphate isomerase/epimerase